MLSKNKPQYVRKSASKFVVSIKIPPFFFENSSNLRSEGFPLHAVHGALLHPPEPLPTLEAVNLPTPLPTLEAVQ